MILLIGGTSETALLALALAEAGFEVLVSTSTDIPLDVGTHPNLTRRVGMLNHDGMSRLMKEFGIRLVVDSSHPYASSVTANARRAASERNVPYLRWARPSDLAQAEGPILAENHEMAARIACAFGRAVLLTTGSRNLVPYVREARRTAVVLVVRVLPYPESMEACRRAGVHATNIVAGRGPFSVEDNLSVMRRFNIGVLVTKDSGSQGGVPQKVEAARIHGCPVVVVRRPEEFPEKTFSDISELVAAVSSQCAIKEATLVGRRNGSEVM